MSDNTTLNLGAGGDTLRSVDRGGVKTQVVALDLDPGGTEALTTGTLPVSGNVAHSAADSGNPVKVGSRAVSALPTDVVNNDRSDLLATLLGQVLVGHIDPTMQVWKAYNTTSQQTGTTVWQPASGKRIAITSIVVSTYGTTAARMQLWFGASGDTTYSAGTDQLVLPGNFVPSATSKPGIVFCPAVPVFCTTADYYLKITTDAALSVDIAVYGYEF